MPSSARRALVALTLVLGLTAAAPAIAEATITPALTASPSSTAAGSSVSLTTDVQFAPSSGDSPKDLTLSLPAGLLSNAAINGGACLSATSPVAACQVGTGTVTAGLPPLGLPTTLSITLYLVAPPKPSDLAGLWIQAGFPLNSQLGSPGEVSIRPAGNPRGVGVDVAFANIPNQVAGLPISVSDLKTTLTGVRMPTSCPSTPATFVVRADSYKDSTQRTASAPLTVTGCNSLPFTPQFSVAAVRDATDSGVALTTDITQPAAPPQATDRAAVLTLPPSLFAPNVNAVLTGGILCPALSPSCTPIGSASSTSPLYPRTLTGSAYLIGSLSNLNNIQLALVFPAPFALTLIGTVNVTQGTTTFSGLPDLPLTDLKVMLFGGPKAAFTATCNPATGTASSTLTTQNGDRTVTASAPVTVSGCPSGGGGGTGGGGTGGGGTGGGGTGGGGTGGGTHHPPIKGRPHTASDAVWGFARGRPSLRFTLTAGRNSPKLSSVIIVVPHGLAIVHGRRHHPGTVVSLAGAKLKSVVFSQGRIVITLRRPVARLTVTIRGLAVTRKLARAVRHHTVKRLTIAIIPRDSAGTRALLSAVFVVRP